MVDNLGAEAQGWGMFKPVSLSAPPARAAAMMILCCAFVALSTFFAKALGRGVSGEPMHAFQIVLARYFFAFIAVLPFALVRRVRLRNVPWPTYAGRAFCGWGGVTCLFSAALLIPLADATAISFLSPVFAMLLAVLFLGETVGRVRWTAASVALIGGLLLIRPGIDAVQTGALIALGAAAFMAAEIILAKILARTEDVVRILLITNLIAVCFATLTASFVWRPPTLAEVALGAAVGWSMLSAQALFMSSLKIADASFVTPFFYATLIFAAAYDAIWFGTIPVPLSIAGAVLIVLGAAILAVREGRAGRTPAPPTHSG